MILLFLNCVGSCGVLWSIIISTWKPITGIVTVIVVLLKNETYILSWWSWNRFPWQPSKEILKMAACLGSHPCHDIGSFGKTNSHHVEKFFHYKNAFLKLVIFFWTKKVSKKWVILQGYPPFSTADFGSQWKHAILRVSDKETSWSPAARKVVTSLADQDVEMVARLPGYRLFDVVMV